MGPENTPGEERLQGFLRAENGALGNLLTELTLQQHEYLSDAVTRLIEDAIADRLEEVTGNRYERQDISDYLHGRRYPGPEFIPMFAEAFSLSVAQRKLLAWAYAYSEYPD